MLIDALEGALLRERVQLETHQLRLSKYHDLAERCEALLHDPNLELLPNEEHEKLQQSIRDTEELIGNTKRQITMFRGRVAALETDLEFERRQLQASSSPEAYFAEQQEAWEECWRFYTTLVYTHAHPFANADPEAFRGLSAAELYQRECEFQERFEVPDVQPFREWFLSFKSPPAPLDLNAWPQTVLWPPDEPTGMWGNLMGALVAPDRFVNAYARGSLYVLGAARAMREYRSSKEVN